MLQAAQFRFLKPPPVINASATAAGQGAAVEATAIMILGPVRPPRPSRPGYATASGWAVRCDPRPNRQRARAFTRRLVHLVSRDLETSSPERQSRSRNRRAKEARVDPVSKAEKSLTPILRHQYRGCAARALRTVRRPISLFHRVTLRTPETGFVLGLFVGCIKMIKTGTRS